MIKKFHYKDLLWIDMQSPTKAEIEEVTKEYKIHPVASSELSKPSVRSHVDIYDDFIYLVLHFPTCQICYGDRAEGVSDVEEIDFIVGKDFLITTHYQEINTLHEFAKIFEIDWLQEKSKKEKMHAGFLMYYIIREMYGDLQDGLDYINGSLKSIEKNIFGGKEKEMVETLSKVNRNLIDFKWAIKSHVEILPSLEGAGKQFFGESFSYYLSGLHSEYDKIWNMLEGNRETFLDLQSTNDSLLSTKTNEIMKTLTIMAFITFPLSVITSLFGMNTINMPFVSHEYGFWIVITIMVAAVVIMFGYFKHKKWF